MIVFLSDIDECLTNPCSPNGACTNTKGSFSCQCNAGYSGNGFVCTSMYLKNIINSKISSIFRRAWKDLKVVTFYT